MKRIRAGANVDLCRQLLDHALIDAEDMPCGTVDDVEIEGGVGEPMRVTALLVGPGAWAPRLPALFARLAAWVFGTRYTRVPWQEVGEIGEKIRLRSRAAPLGLGITERRIGLWIARLPLSDKGTQREGMP
jgi:sporulation protein YlmC with PRC-barrel domain